MVKKNEKGFVIITNRDVYYKLIDMEKTMTDFMTLNTADHVDILKKQDYTNGSVKNSKWIASTALTITLILLGFLFNHLSAVGV